MCFHVQELSRFNQTSLVPFFPHEPSSSARKPCGGYLSRYSPQVISLMGDCGFANSRAKCARNCGPSNHQCPNNSASNGAVRMGGTPPVVGYFPIASWAICAKCAA